ncbi:MAG: hypothetical protein HY900_08545 [Deltaproteobacteria bacterium]|nr:hypothetical protein [Deltaproteobacteria bacterium]
MKRALAYAWALPNTFLGLAAAALALATGGEAHLVGGVLEVHGGFARWLLARAVPLPGGCSAMALGHVVLGVDRGCLQRTRAHERVHVRQCERWGPLFLPAYFAASGWALLRRRDPYRANVFERAAYREHRC